MPVMLPAAAALSRWTDPRRATFYAKTDLARDDAELAALRQLPDDAFGLTADRLHAAATHGLGEAPLGIERLPAQGTFHRLFRLCRRNGSTAVLRVFVLADDCDGATLLEPWIAARSGVPVPPVLAVDLSRAVVPFDYVVSGEAEGACLAAFDDDEDRTLAALAALGAAVARLHGVAVDGWGLLDAEHPGRGLDRCWSDYFRRNLYDHLDRCRAAGLIDAVEAGRAATLVHALPELEGPAALLHGDLGSHNAFFGDGRLTALVDWEDALGGDPVFDVAFWATFHPERRHQAFLDGYRSVRPLPADFHRRFWTSFLRVSLAKTAHRLRFGYADRVDRPPASRRIQLALQRLEEGPCASS